MYTHTNTPNKHTHACMHAHTHTHTHTHIHTCMHSPTVNIPTHIPKIDVCYNIIDINLLWLYATSVADIF